ncbi:KTSC domain-containing protein [Leucobacter sp. HY1910]
MNATQTQGQARHDAGVRRAGVAMGGKFSKTQSTAASGAGLYYAPLEHAAEQRDAIAERFVATGYAPATSVESATNPRYTDGIDEWWLQHYERMEQPADGKTYAMMPDDYTPSRTDGHALSGKRRTHRMRYSGAGVEMRMPSATAIRRFSAENGKRTFDVPIEMEHAGGRISGFARVTQGADGAWDVKALNMPQQAASRAQEAVACVLEARRPTIALKQAEAQYAAHRKARQSAAPLHGASPLHQRRLERVAQEGARLGQPRVNSPLVKGVGYDSATGTMTINLRGRYYGYKVPKETYQEIASSLSPGAAYNQLVKGRRSKRAEVQCCRRCRRWTLTQVKHSCPVKQRGIRRDKHRARVASHVMELALARHAA